jgi:hypothetical protein
MIRLFEAPELCHRGAQIPRLLEWAELTLDDELAGPVEIRLSGVAARLAFEFHLAELCRQHGPPKGIRWHSYAIRLLKCGVFTIDDYKTARRISRLACKAVHGKPFDRTRAGMLYAAVSEFVSVRV